VYYENFSLLCKLLTHNPLTHNGCFLFVVWCPSCFTVCTFVSNEVTRCWHDTSTEEASYLYYNWSIFLIRWRGIR